MPDATKQHAQAAALNELLEFDRQHIWHPYSSLTKPLTPVPVVGASGVRLQLADGRELIDGMASWWSVIHGYNHPQLNQAIKNQVDQFSHVMFGGLTHEPAIKLCQQLINITPSGLEKIFLSDSGSVSVEVAIKMALQYWYSIGKKGKHRLLALRNGYHGDTFAAMAVCDPVTGMHHLFSEVLPQHLFAPAPQCKFNEPCEAGHIVAMKELLATHHQELAAVIIEPVVQGAGGMRIYSPDYVRQLRALCDEYDVLLIADEIATGFARTGKMFACEHAGIEPDILCLGKAMTGGYMTMAATLCTAKIAEGICNGEAGVFMHGPTFMGNALAAAVANASIDLLLSQDWQSNIQRIETRLSAGLAPAAELEQVADVRVLGAIGVIELKAAVDMATIQPKFVAEGIWVRPFGKLVYVMPPYIISDAELSTLCSGMLKVIAEIGR